MKWRVIDESEIDGLTKHYPHAVGESNRCLEMCDLTGIYDGWVCTREELHSGPCVAHYPYRPHKAVLVNWLGDWTFLDWERAQQEVEEIWRQTA